MKQYGATLTTPLGPFSAVARDGVVRAAGFTNLDEVAQRVRGEISTVVDHAADIFLPLRQYLEGRVDALAELPVEQEGSPLFQSAWAAMRAVSAGERVTYTELAARAGAPRAVRAVASACARNAICLVIPCHRVVPTGGGPGRYYYGPDYKTWLLDHEARARTRIAA